MTDWVDGVEGRRLSGKCEAVGVAGGDAVVLAVGAVVDAGIAGVEYETCWALS